MQGDRPRRLSATFFAEWVLGTLREQAPMRVVTEVDAESGALLARHAFHAGCPRPGGVRRRQRPAADIDRRPHRVSGPQRLRDGARRRFAGSVYPDGSASLSIRAPPCTRPSTCGPAKRNEIVFVLGAARDTDTARQYARRFRDPARIDALLEEVRAVWDRVLGAVQVRTPDPALDVLLNRWLPYQVLSCRVWGRIGVLPIRRRVRLPRSVAGRDGPGLRAPRRRPAPISCAAAGRQFVEGDVQHWWHPPLGRGVRTHISDDYLWLPYAVCHYVTVTGDLAILDERVPFLIGPGVPPDQ